MKEIKALQDEKMYIDYLEHLRQLRPQVHCITNVITINDCANALLAIGAAPTMSHHPLEVADVARMSNALVLNMGAMESLEAMKVAGLAAKEAGHPIILDPVGAGGATYRREQTLEIIAAVQPDCIRGNLSELKALAANITTTRGVEVNRKEAVDLDMLAELSQKLGAIIVASGKTDYVVDAGRKCREQEGQLNQKQKGQFTQEQKEQLNHKREEQTESDHVTEPLCISVSGGSEYMPRVTGTGCVSSALLGAFLSVERSAESAAACLQYISSCAEKAEAKTKEVNGGTMTFRMYFIDELSK